MSLFRDIFCAVLTAASHEPNFCAKHLKRFCGSRAPTVSICGSKTMTCASTGKPWRARNPCFVLLSSQQSQLANNYLHKTLPIPGIA